jgi:WD40 repeat protein
LDSLLLEAMRAKRALRTKAPVALRKLGAKALSRRRGMEVDWGRYSGGGAGRRLEGHEDEVYALAECSGRMCSGSEDGSIRVWSIATLEEERVIDNCNDAVWSLAAWEGELISGHGSGRIRAWDAASVERRRELEGHARHVSALRVCGSRLASGSGDHTIKVWRMGQSGVEWACERTLEGHSDCVYTLAAWGDKLISGSRDDTIRVWDLSTGGLDATLTGHEDSVNALVVEGGRLYSASLDGTIRVWDVGAWAEAMSMAACEAGQYPECLLTSGSKLISGCATFGEDSSDDGQTEREVRVWDLDTMACEYTVREAARADVRCLAGSGGAVWGWVGRWVVVWGRD